MPDIIAHWLSLRIRILLVIVFLISTILPPYVAQTALAETGLEPNSNQFLLVEDGFLYKTSTVSLEGGRIAYSKAIVHTVKNGEGLIKLAERYGITIDTIRFANDLPENSTLQPGQQLTILPVDGVLHRVRSGETLIGIANKYKIPLEEIATQNDLKSGFIIAGQGLIIPGGTPIAEAPVVATVPTPTPTKPGNKNLPVPITKNTPRFDPTPTYGTLQKPCSEACFITQYYNGGHYALDMQERGGGPIYAAEAGTVITAKTGWNGGYGNYIIIDHGNGLQTLYAHNKTLLVKEGDSTVRAQKIADMGNSGLVYGKTGIHVHFEVRVNGVKKNPLLYIQ